MKSNINSIKNGVQPSDQSFAARLRHDLLDDLISRPDYSTFAFLACCAAVYRDQRSQLTIHSRYVQIIDFLADKTEELYGKPPERRCREVAAVTWTGDLFRRIERDIVRLIRDDAESLAEEITNVDEQEANDALWQTRAVIGGFFLGGGSISEPEERCHLEFVIADQAIANWLGLFLECLNLSPGNVVRRGASVLYLKGNSQLQDFLQLLGLNNYLLTFAEARIQREFNNQINRIVNCDNANLQRQADSTAKQLADIRLIRQAAAEDRLDPVSVELIQLREENPGLSLRELGNLLTRPLGKSSVNHRFHKISRLAAELSAQ